MQTKIPQRKFYEEQQSKSKGHQQIKRKGPGLRNAAEGLLCVLRVSYNDYRMSYDRKTSGKSFKTVRYHCPSEQR